MLIKKAKYKKCKCCKKDLERISQEVYGCDICGKEIDMNRPERDYLQFVLHHHEKEADWIHACSWKCAIHKVRKIIKEKSSDYFISLPILSLESADPGCTAADFIKELKR